MKKHYIYSLIALVMIIAIPASLVRAEESATVDANASVNVSVSPTPLPPSLPPLSPTVRAKIRADYEARIQSIKANVQNNQAARNGILEERRGIASTTHAEVRDIRTEGRMDIHANASSTVAERRDMRMAMRLDIFKARKEGILQQLNLSITNLKQIRTRISSRIDMEVASSTDMTKAKASLAVADAKIKLADDAILALQAYTPSATTTASTSAEISLERPRQIAEDAIKAVKDARQALQQVIVDIIQSLKGDLKAHLKADVEVHN